jgi:chemotaxis protein MotB
VTTSTGSNSLIQRTNNPSMDSSGTSKNSGSPFEASVLRRVMDQLQSLNMPTDGENRPVQLRVTPEGLEVSVFDRAKRPLFVGTTDKLTMYGRWVFSTLAWPIAENPESKIEIGGHSESGQKTDSAHQSVWDLSADRAKTVRHILINYGVHEDQIRKVSGYGDLQPLNVDKPHDPENRRVTVLFRMQNPMDAAS